jgi:bacterioferritin
MYQYLTLYDSYKEVASILEGIAKVERVHLQMLGKMIKALGVEPKYEGVERGKMRPWNANYLSYDTGVKEIIKVGVREEEKSIRQYRDHISRIQDRNIQETLQRILLDEKHHLEIFRSLYKRYGE